MKEEQQLPQELKLGDDIVGGGAAKKAWRDAFQKLGKVNEKDPDFDEQFLQECQQQIGGWIQKLNEDRGELDKDIERADKASGWCWHRTVNTRGRRYD